MNEAMLDGNAMTDEAKRVEDALALAVKVSEKGVKSLLFDILQATVGVERDLLECALDREKLVRQFPESILRENQLIVGMPRLRYDDRYWTLAISGCVDNEMEEIYNYMQWVRIPKMAFQFLKAMNAESVTVLLALKEKQYDSYKDFGDLARKVLQAALDVLGAEKIATLMSVDVCALHESLKKLEL